MGNDTMASAVKHVFAWRVRPDTHDAFAQWARRFVANGAAARGYEGSSVFSSHDEWLVLVRFGSAPDFERWRDSADVASLLAEAAPLASGAPRTEQRTGLEAWFTLPGERGHAPARWKMALVTWCALLPQVLALGYVMPASLPPLARTALGTAIPVVLLTWIVMPMLTRFLSRWLYPT